MCGIAGIFNYQNRTPVSVNLLEKMLYSLKHRGPDELGTYVNQNIGFGNVRLSIIDLLTGQQPMCDVSRSYWVVFNGEIFNYIELREELERKGCRFLTKSDTEVAVVAYAFWEESCLSRFNGQFALAIWDTNKEELFLARDRVGICPLFYANVKGTFTFGSEIKAIFQHPVNVPELSIHSLGQIFTFWSTLSPATPFYNVFEVPPGHFIKISKEKFLIDKYWQLKFPIGLSHGKINAHEAGEELSAILTEAVRIRLRADVPVAAYLSGGLDSTSITSIIKQLKPGLLRTFSLGFKDKTFDETEFQLQAIGFLNTIHNSIECTNEEIADIFPDVIWHTESPVLRTAPAPMYRLSKLVRQNNIKVVITGEGADEMFGGYDIFKEMIIRRFWAQSPDSKYRPLLLKRLYPFIPQIGSNNLQVLKFFYGFRLENVELPYYSHILRWNNGRNIIKYIHPDHQQTIKRFDPFENWSTLMPKDFEHWNNLSKAQYIETTLFMSGYLLSSQGDRMTMANSVEARYPFLDNNLIDFALRLPENLKIKGLNEKYLLKKIMKNKIPESIIKRNKQPYRAPIRSSFFRSSCTHDYIDEMLDSRVINDYGIFDSALTSKLIHRIKASGTATEMESMIVTAIISTQLLYKLFIKETNSVFPKPSKTVYTAEYH